MLEVTIINSFLTLICYLWNLCLNHHVIVFAFTKLIHLCQKCFSFFNLIFHYTTGQHDHITGNDYGQHSSVTIFLILQVYICWRQSTAQHCLMQNRPLCCMPSVITRQQVSGDIESTLLHWLTAVSCYCSNSTWSICCPNNMQTSLQQIQ